MRFFELVLDTPRTDGGGGGGTADAAAAQAGATQTAQGQTAQGAQQQAGQQTQASATEAQLPADLVDFLKKRGKDPSKMSTVELGSAVWEHHQTASTALRNEAKVHREKAEAADKEASARIFKELMGTSELTEDQRGQIQGLYGRYTGLTASVDVLVTEGLISESIGNLLKLGDPESVKASVGVIKGALGQVQTQQQAAGNGGQSQDIQNMVVEAVRNILGGTSLGADLAGQSGQGASGSVSNQSATVGRKLFEEHGRGGAGNPQTTAMFGKRDKQQAT